MFRRGMIYPGGQEPLLKGSSVYLRYPQAGDFPQWSEVRGTSKEFLSPWEPTWAVDELTRAAYRRRLRRYDNEIRNDMAYPFFVFRNTDDVLVGGCTLSNVRRGVCQSASLGYWVGEPYARQGYTLAAVTAIIPFVFETLGLHRLEAACIPDNEPSSGLLRKLGFQEEGRARGYLQIGGEWRDHTLFALLKDDWPVG
jgi:ribosomal-protein-alanine N-acetyltransferase